MDALKQLVVEAVREYGGRGDAAGCFSSANFAVAVNRTLKVQQPSEEWCAKVLKATPFVVPAWESDRHWRFISGGD